MMTDCAVWARVSTTEQRTQNQLTELRAWAEQMGLEVVAEYVTEDSAWAASNGNGKGAEFEAKRQQVLQGVRHGQASGGALLGDRPAVPPGHRGHDQVPAAAGRVRGRRAQSHDPG